MRRMLCLCNTCLLYTRVIQKGRVIPILNNRFDDMSKVKTVVEDRGSSHRLDNYWPSWLGCTPKRRESVGDRPDVLGDRRICEESASGFVQTQNELVWTVCLTLDFILCDWFRLHSVNCLCGMLRCKWSRLLLKSRVLWLMIKWRPLWHSFV